MEKLNEKISERYKKVLVTVSMGFRTEDEVKKNGLMIFTKEHKDEVFKYVKQIFKKGGNALVLKVKPIGYRSEHIVICSNEDLENFKINIDNIYGEANEIWVVNSSNKFCWRCRILLTKDSPDIFEMAFSKDDHILNNLSKESNVEYARFTILNQLKINETNLNKEKINEAIMICNDVYNKYLYEIKKVKEDMELLNIKTISLDIRVNDGYDFHDFDVEYNSVKKVVDFYYNIYIQNKEKKAFSKSKKMICSLASI